MSRRLYRVSYWTSVTYDREAPSMDDAEVKLWEGSLREASRDRARDNVGGEVPGSFSVQSHVYIEDVTP